MLTTATIAAFLFGVLSHGVVNEAVKKAVKTAQDHDNKLSPQGYDALPPKPVAIEKLPELKRFSKGARTYRDAGDEPMRCHRCERPCIYCKRLGGKPKRIGR